MRKEFALFGAMTALATGCASQPNPDPWFEHTTNHVQTAAAHMEYPEPVALPLEAELNGPHDVDFYVQLALERNPEIIAAQRRVAAQAEVIPQVTALNDPILTDTVWPGDDNSPQTAAGRAPNMLSLSQQFPWSGKLRLRGEVAEQQAKIALTELAATQLKTVEAVKLSYFDLWFNQQAVEITETSGELLNDLLKFAEARYRTGGSQQDVLRAQLEIDRLQDQLIQFRRALSVSQADLAKFVHTSPDASPAASVPDVTQSVPEQIDRLYEAAVRCRPELQQQLHMIVRDQRTAQLARLNYYPDVTTAISWQAITHDNALSPVSNGNDNIGLGIGVNLPIWRDKLRAGVREAEHRTVSTARIYDATRDDTFRIIKRLIVQAHALDEQIALFRDSIVPRAEQTLRISVADYRVGKVDFQQIIDNWTDLLQFQIQLIRFRMSLGQTIASLERVIGCQLATLPEFEQASANGNEPRPFTHPAELRKRSQNSETAPKE